MKLIKFLNYPYPFYENARQGFKICLGIGIFITAFCFFFRPFGLDELSTLGLIGYGLVSFLICSFHIVVLPLIFKKNLKTEGWKIYKEILWILAINISLAFGNYFYSGFIFRAGYRFDIKIFLIVLFCTIIVAVIPAIAIILYKQLFVYKKILKDVKKIDAKLIESNNSYKHISKELKVLTLSESKKDQFKINANDFVLLSSAGNYVEIFFKENQTIQKKLLRNNIYKIEQQLKKFDHIIRCHRSHIVNLNHIKKVTGNLQGYQLSIEGLENLIPVSRSYSKAIKNKILK